jgi:hypothetical protein
MPKWFESPRLISDEFHTFGVIFLPVAFFFPFCRPDATEQNGFIYLAHIGAAFFLLD